MYIPGHLAMGYLIVAGPALAKNRPLDVRHALLPALVGSLTPDIIDKSLQLTPLTPYGRTVGHSIFVLAGLVILWQWAVAKKAPEARPMGWWIAGIAAHITIDFINDIFRGIEHTGYLFAAWMGWPNTNPDMWQVTTTVENPCQYCYSSLEIGFLAMVMVVGVAQYLQHTRFSPLSH